MPDDPRSILKAAGMKCRALDEYQLFRNGAVILTKLARNPVVRQDKADAAMLALARIVAELVAKLDDRTERVKQAIERSRVTAVSPQDVLDLIDRVALMQDDEKRDAYLAAKYKWQRDELKRELALDLDDGLGLSMMSMASGAISKELDRRWEEHDA